MDPVQLGSNFVIRDLPGPNENTVISCDVYFQSALVPVEILTRYLFLASHCGKRPHRNDLCSTGYPRRPIKPQERRHLGVRWHVSVVRYLSLKYGLYSISDSSPPASHKKNEVVFQKNIDLFTG
jgi:hypothetical protein